MENKYLTYLLLILVVSFFSSCTPERREIELTFVFDKPLEKADRYPDYFKEISTPFSTTCGDETTDFLFKPISITRLDVSKSSVQTNAWFFKDIGDNTIEFSKLWLDIYFKDSIPPAHLFAKSRIKTNIDKYIDKHKENIFILSEESDDEMYKDVPIYNSSTELYNAIRKKVCDNTSGKIMVLVNPGYSSPRKKDNDNDGIPNEEDACPDEPGSLQHKGCPNDRGGGVLAETLNKVGNYRLPIEARDELARSTVETYFTKNAMVKVYMNGRFIEEHPAKTYLDYLSTYTTLEKVIVKEAIEDKKANNKVRLLMLEEVHSQDQ